MTDAVVIQPGTVLLDTYRIERQIGAGGMGTVYVAREIDSVIGRLVAIKILPPRLAADERLLARFRAEMNIAANLDHPYVVPIYRVEADQGLHFFVMKYLAGRTLYRIVREDGAFNARQMVDIFLQVSRALEYMHGRACVHRGVKATNIMVASNGHATLMDFGFAKVQDESTLADAGEILGRAPYMAPEQWEGNPDRRSDLYSLGIVMYEMATGEAPFSGKSLPEIMSKHLAEMPVPITESRVDLSPELNRVVMRCLAKDPDARYQSAGAIRRDLRALRPLDVEDPTLDAAPSLDRTVDDTLAAIPVDERVIELVRPLVPVVAPAGPPVPVLKKIRASDKCLARGDLAGAIWHLEQLVRNSRGDAALVGDQVAALRLMAVREDRVRRRAEAAVAAGRYLDAEILLQPLIELYEHTPLAKLYREVVAYRDETAAYFDRAQEQQFRTRYRKAEGLYRKVLEREPDMDLAEDRIQLVRKLRSRQRRRTVAQLAVFVLLLAGFVGGLYVFRQSITPYALRFSLWLATQEMYTGPPLLNANDMLRAVELLDAGNPRVPGARRALKQRVLAEAERKSARGFDLEALRLYREALAVDPEDEALRKRIESLRAELNLPD